MTVSDFLQLDGKRILVFGVANRKSVAYHIARSLGGKFMDAGEALKHNFMAMFTDATVDWHSLKIFYDEVFFPYLIGGIIPGLVAATICYIISVPLIRAYQKRRSGVIKAKLAALKAKAKRSAEARQKTD